MSLFRVIFWNSSSNSSRNGRYGKEQEKKDLLELLQKEYPTNPYVKKVSKTFLSRRLNKTVIYRHNFQYNPDGTFAENKLDRKSVV